ncbi:AsmA family protein [bacterium]|nr:AsmA family protein [bacterium]|tara:strand:+ start:52 stop:1221 length:1170 start_codon:yes stop_codon:yes gene_type:complete
MNRKVLNRPMFARMRDGSIKPVQYAFTGLAVSGGSKLLPYIPRGLQAIKNTLPAIISKGKNLITGGGSKIKGGGTGTAVGPYLGGGGSGLPAIIKGSSEASKKGKGLLKMFGYGTAPMAIASLTDFSEQVEEKKKPYKPHKPNMLDVAGPKKVEKEDKVTEEVITDINKGNLDEMITEKIDLFKEKLGSGKGRMKTAGFGMLTEIGLNLMQAKGGNFLDKLSRSAIDPLKTFTKIGQAINDRMDKITMAGIESGVKSFEADKDRALTEKQIDAQSKPDDVRTLEYLQQLPGIKGLPIEQVIRLSKNKAIMSDQEFYQELALNLTQGDPNITAAEIEAIFEAIKAGSPSGGGETMTIEEQITILKGQDKTDSEIKEALIAIGEDPSKYGY